MMNILSRGKQIRNVRWHAIVIDIMHFRQNINNGKFVQRFRQIQVISISCQHTINLYRQQINKV